MSGYDETYRRWRSDPDAFWLELAGAVEWEHEPQVGLDSSNAPLYRWFPDGRLNMCFNLLDRHVRDGRGDQTALIWEGDDPKDSRTVTYKQLYAEVSRFANVLKKLGVKKGDRVTIYLPMVLEAAYAILACARIGAIHSVIFGGFSPDSIAGRVEDCKSDIIVTADEGVLPGDSAGR